MARIKINKDVLATTKVSTTVSSINRLRIRRSLLILSHLTLVCKIRCVANKILCACFVPLPYPLAQAVVTSYILYFKKVRLSLKVTKVFDDAHLNLLHLFGNILLSTFL